LKFKMFEIFGQFTSFLKIKQTPSIDNNICRLHYKVSVVILTMCSLLVTARQYIGDPIDCMVEGIPGGLMDTYCWIQSTFSIPERFVGKQGEDHAYPGAAHHVTGGDGKDPIYHKYYQWVCFVLFFQAGLFHVPHLLWKAAEGGRLNMLVQDMLEPKMVVKKEMRAERIRVIVKYFKEYRGSHFLYFLKYLGCELLNMINVMGQMFLMDRFLGGEFTTYGLKVLNFTEQPSAEREDPMAVVFPKVSKCTFSKYGPSGTVEIHDGLCVLPLNIINEKIYIFLWFWFILLASITGLFLIYRVAVLLGPGIRVAMIQARCGRLARDKIEDIVCSHKLSYREQVGDFFLLYLIGKNVDEVTMKELITSLHATLRPDYSEAPTLRAGFIGKKTSV